MTGLRPPIKISIKYSGKYHGGLSNPLVAALTGTLTVQHEHVWILLGSLRALSCVSFYCYGYPVLPPAAF